MNEVTSPLTGSENVIKLQVIDILYLKKKYETEYKTDVTRFFKNVTELAIYECQESKLKFYYPFSVVSDGEFYSDIAKRYAGYYNLWKWEHEKVIQYIQPNDKVLEIGSGNGYFLQKLSEKKSIPIGLDFNPKAIEEGKRMGITILNEIISEHSKKYFEYYDAVCAFQLFEHVNDVSDFLKNTIDCLKKGGLLAIGVPNNDSYYFKNDTYHTLNLPPHHMLLWDSSSLEYVAKKFNLEIIEIQNQPVNSIHKGIIYKLWLKNKLGDNFVCKIVTLTTRFIVKVLPVFKKQGVTIVAVYRKK